MLDVLAVVTVFLSFQNFSIINRFEALKYT